MTTFDISKDIGSFVRNESLESNSANIFLPFQLIFISVLFYRHKDFFTILISNKYLLFLAIFNNFLYFFQHS